MCAFFLVQREITLIILGISSADQQPDIYEDRFNTIVENGFVALGISLGREVGLFKALIELSEPATSLAIAQHANLHERYKFIIATHATGLI